MVLRWFLRRWVHLALCFRFRKIQIVHHTPISTDEPAIIAGNHQNALLDSITLAACSPKVPFTLSRGALFENPLARWILGSLRMLPIYRFRDGFRMMRQNPEVFSQFVEVLSREEWLLIFPEGSHLLGYKLRPLQRGVARIAFAAQEAQDWQKEVPIIPVGLQYESHTILGSRLLIQYGPPVSTLAFRTEYSENPKAAERALTAKLFEEIKRLLVVLPADDEAYEHTLQFWERNRKRVPNLMEQFQADGRLVADWAKGLEEEDHPASAHRGSTLRKMSGYVLSLPGFFFHLPVLMVVLALEKVFIKDMHLAPSARFVGGMFFTPLWYLLATGLWHVRFGSFALDLGLLAIMLSSLWLWSRSWHWTR